jgi:uncharacterized membrane protein YeaQ/YmgE (transglycosylase-associated protein family)
MDPAALIVMLVIGAIAGWLASVVVGGKAGLLFYIISGIIGGIVGPIILSAIKVKIDLGHPTVNTIITSAIGAMVVILLARILG